MTMKSQYADMNPSSLVKFSYWFKFHVSIISGSRVMSILLSKGLTRSPEDGNIPVCVSPNV